MREQVKWSPARVFLVTSGGKSQRQERDATRRNKYREHSRTFEATVRLVSLRRNGTAIYDSTCTYPQRRQCPVTVRQTCSRSRLKQSGHSSHPCASEQSSFFKRRLGERAFVSRGLREDRIQPANRPAIVTLRIVDMLQHIHHSVYVQPQHYYPSAEV